MDRSYLGEVDVEEERLLGAGHLNPVPAGAGLLLLRVAARLHRHRRLVARHVENSKQIDGPNDRRGFARLAGLGLGFFVPRRRRSGWY